MTAIDRLTALGFNPIELERGSTGFKIWKRIKIKRIRVPDILCLNTGSRFESRGKTVQEISMSHSLKDPNRAWDFGMRDDDWVVITFFRQAPDSPLDVTRISPVHFISVADMRAVFAKKQINTSTPKGFEEGSEIRVIWPCACAKFAGKVTEITPKQITLESPTGGKQRIKLERSKGIVLISQVSVNDPVDENQIIASVVPVHVVLTPGQIVDENHFIQKLRNVNLSERYASAKALRYRGFANAEVSLQARLDDNAEDIYVQLEAAAALASKNDEKGWDFIESKVRAAVMISPLETQLETVIVASELQNPRSENLLIEVLADGARDEELRAGAAWALGQFKTNNAATALVDSFDVTPLEIKTEAARALLRISDTQIPFLVGLITQVDPKKRDGIAWVLAKVDSFAPNSLLDGADDNLRKWIAYMIGYGKENFPQAEIEKIAKSDPEVYFAASVLWQILESWVNNMGEY